MASEQGFSPEFGRAIRDPGLHSPLAGSFTLDTARDETHHVLLVVQRLVRQELADVRTALGHSCSAVDEVQRIVHAELSELRADVTQVRAAVMAEGGMRLAGSESAVELPRQFCVANGSCKERYAQQSSVNSCMLDRGVGAKDSSRMTHADRLESVVTFGLAEVREFAQELVVRERSAWESKHAAMREHFDEEVTASLARHVALLDAVNALEVRAPPDECKVREEMDDLDGRMQASLAQLQVLVSKHEVVLESLSHTQGVRDGDSRTQRTASKSPIRRPGDKKIEDGSGGLAPTPRVTRSVTPGTTRSALGGSGRGRGGRPRGTF